jgi:hypothetical protein
MAYEWVVGGSLDPFIYDLERQIVSKQIVYVALSKLNQSFRGARFSGLYWGMKHPKKPAIVGPDRWISVNQKWFSERLHRNCDALYKLPLDIALCVAKCINAIRTSPTWYPTTKLSVVPKIR